MESLFSKMVRFPFILFLKIVEWGWSSEGDMYWPTILGSDYRRAYIRLQWRFSLVNCGVRWKKMEIGSGFWRMVARGKFCKDYYLKFELGMSLHASEPFPVNPGTRTNFPGHFLAASREDLRGGARGNAIHADNDPPCPGLCI